MGAKEKNVQLKIILRRIGTFSLCLLLYECLVRAWIFLYNAVQKAV